MEEKNFEVLKWAAGIFMTLLTGMGIYIMFLHKQHKKERTESREDRKEGLKIIDEGRKESNIVVKDNTEQQKETGSILSALKQLLEIDIQTRVRKP